MTAKRRGPRPAEERLQLLLVMLPWLMERGEVPLAEAAGRFGLSERELERDLELVAMCGLPPYVDELIDVFIDDGMIWVGVPRLFTKPLNLTAVEAWELLAAGRAALALPGADPDGALARGLAKLGAASGQRSAVEIELERPVYTDEFAAGIDDGSVFEIGYVAASGASTVRTIVPRRVFTTGGEWYVVADDDRSGEQRHFRIDRVEWAVDTGETRPGARPAGPDVVDGEWFRGGDFVRARLRLSRNARWVSERFPCDDVGEPGTDGWFEVVMPVANERWFVGLLVALGPDAELIEPAELGVARSELARSVLAVYRS